MIKFSPLKHKPTFFVLGVILGIALVILPMQSKLSERAHSHQNQYGTALVNAAAREAVEPAFRKDLISLSVIVEAVASNPEVLQAAIYNVEGRVLVQAGKESHELDKDKEVYQATISLQDSVAGIVTVTLSKSEPDAALKLSFYYLLIALGLAYSLYQAIRLQVIRFEHSDIDTPALEHGLTIDANDSSSAEPEQEETESEPNIDSEPEQALAYATLCVKNVGTLQQQLNGETFRATFRKLEQKLSAICQLYGSTTCYWERDRYVVVFASVLESDALFNAACAARLMLDLTGVTNRIPLDLSAQVSLEQANTLADPMPFVGLAVHEAKQAFTYLEQRVKLLEISDEDTTRRLIESFEQPYSELLKKQTAQLSEQLSEKTG